MNLIQVTFWTSLLGRMLNEFKHLRKIAGFWSNSLRVERPKIMNNSQKGDTKMIGAQSMKLYNTRVQKPNSQAEGRAAYNWENTRPILVVVETVNIVDGPLPGDHMEIEDAVKYQNSGVTMTVVGRDIQ